MKDISPPPGTWHSPFSNSELTADEIVRELALNAVSKLLMVGLISDDAGQVSMTPDAIIVSAPMLNYAGVIRFPPPLFDHVRAQWPQWFDMFKSDYGLGSALDLVMPPPALPGEKLGRLFRHFKIIDQLCLAARMAPWPKDIILGIHGVDDPEIIGKLKKAGIIHILIWREEHLRETETAPSQNTAERMIDCIGSGCLKRLCLSQAETLAIDSNARRPGSTREIFDLDHPFEVDSWSSNHPRFLS